MLDNFHRAEPLDRETKFKITRLYEDMGIELARANYRMLMERTLPPRVGG